MSSLFRMLLALLVLLLIVPSVLLVQAMGSKNRSNNKSSNNIKNKNKKKNDGVLSPTAQSVQSWAHARCGITNNPTAKKNKKNNEIFSPYYNEATVSNSKSKKTKHPNNNDNNNNDINLQKGTQNKQLWIYEGVLVDPLTGQTIAGVEGLEIVVPIAEYCHQTADATKKQSFLSKCSPLQVSKIVASTTTTTSNNNNDNNDDTAPPILDYAATMLSRKLFCYKSLPGSQSAPKRPLKLRFRQQQQQQQQNSNHQKRQRQRLELESWENEPEGGLLKRIQFRPNGPIKSIPVSQSVTLFETATTWMVFFGKDLVVHSEWPNPNQKSFWGMANIDTDVSNQNDNNNKKQKLPFKSSSSSSLSLTPLQFTVYTRGKKRSLQSFLELIQKAKKAQGNNKKNNNDSTKSSTSSSSLSSLTNISPPRSSWIQMGGTSQMEQNNKFGARETYSYSIMPKLKKNQNNVNKVKIQDSMATTTVQYTRYGEAPPFYGPNRLCTLELKGRRVSSLTEAPPVISSVIQRFVPNFLQDVTLDTFFSSSSTNNNDNNNNSELPQPVKVIHDHHQEPFRSENNGQINWTSIAATMESIWERVREATIISSSINNSNRLSFCYSFHFPTRVGLSHYW